MSSDTELIARTLAGETEAYSVLIERYEQQSYGLARQILGNHHDAEDCVQEAFIKAYEKLHTFRGNARFYTWLYRIVYNQCHDKLRASAKRGEVTDFPLDSVMEKTASIDKSNQNDGFSESVNRAINTLPPKQRMVFLLRAREALQFKEIAVIMKMTTSSAKTNYHYAVRRMRDNLDATKAIPAGLARLANEGEN